MPARSCDSIVPLTLDVLHMGIQTRELRGIHVELVFVKIAVCLSSILVRTFADFHIRRPEKLILVILKRLSFIYLHHLINDFTVILNP